MKKHIDAISEKYIIKNETSDQAILFLPAETQRTQRSEGMNWHHLLTTHNFNHKGTKVTQKWQKEHEIFKNASIFFVKKII